MFDAEGCSGIDASGVEALNQIIDAPTKDDIALAFARLKSHQMEQAGPEGGTA